jgi:hypothetical protein
MRLSSAAAATALTAAAFLPAATPAFATASAPETSPAPLASVSPSTVAPGGRVALNIAGCGTRTGRASSNAFGEVQLTPGNLEASNLFGSATVFRNTSPGTHRVTFDCGGRQVAVSLYVTPGAARGGLGGSFGGMSPTEILVGGGLVATAVAAGLYTLRRRSPGPTA